jgi:hypothetical protein
LQIEIKRTEYLLIFDLIMLQNDKRRTSDKHYSTDG